MPTSLQESEIWKAFSAARGDAHAALKALFEQFKDQEDLLSDWLGQGKVEAEQQLENLASNGADAIPAGLRRDVVDAYHNLAQIIADAPDELIPWVDKTGVQAIRAELTAQASQLMGAAGTAGAGAAGVGSTWPAWLIPSLVGLVVLLGVGGLWMLTHRESRAILGTWHTDVCGYSDVMVLNLNIDKEGKLAGTIAIKDFVEAVGTPPCTMTEWDGVVAQSPLIEPHLSGKVLTFSTTFGGLAANMRMVLDGNKLIWQSDQRYVLTKR